ncbi:hypothetical protein DPMN_042733 [Dreissena polymorpha]|uniref:Uncharacterized protein n=1 Tax=Dreissena polymorpha TaxID=45954 RepID=A0A9D4D030_DREPO|nr:hypothetical protein DPMN_042733 [Dreissena polymorpha]
MEQWTVRVTGYPKLARVSAVHRHIRAARIWTAARTPRETTEASTAKLLPRQELGITRAILSSNTDSFGFQKSTKEGFLSYQKQYGRRNSIRITGLSNDTDQQASMAVADETVLMLNQKLGTHIEIRDIDVAHRLGKYAQHNAGQALLNSSGAKR